MYSVHQKKYVYIFSIGRKSAKWRRETTKSEEMFTINHNTMVVYTHIYAVNKYFRHAFSFASQQYFFSSLVPMLSLFILAHIILKFAHANTQNDNKSSKCREMERERERPRAKKRRWKNECVWNIVSNILCESQFNRFFLAMSLDFILLWFGWRNQLDIVV